MLKIRIAQAADEQELLRVLEELDFLYSSLSLDHFWVAEKNGAIVGTLRLEEYQDFYFLSCLGVIEKERKHGIAEALLEVTLKNLQKKVYLYTILPAFFEKYGFEETVPLSSLPSKENLGCPECLSEKCVCMVKYPHAA